MAGMRNQLIRNCFGIDCGLVWIVYHTQYLESIEEVLSFALSLF